MAVVVGVPDVELRAIENMDNLVGGIQEHYGPRFMVSQTESGL
jgi:hypothetical protein